MVHVLVQGVVLVSMSVVTVCAAYLLRTRCMFRRQSRDELAVWARLMRCCHIIAKINIVVCVLLLLYLLSMVIDTP